MKKGYYCEVEIDGWTWWPYDSDDADLDEAVDASYVLAPNGNHLDDFQFNDNTTMPKAEDFIDVIIKDYHENKDYFPLVNWMLYTIRDENHREVYTANAGEDEGDSLVFTWYDNEHNVVKMEVYKAKNE